MAKVLSKHLSIELDSYYTLDVNMSTMRDITTFHGNKKIQN